MADLTLSGSHAAYALGHAANLAPKPRSLDHVGAAAVPVAAATALQMVRDLARVAPGQTVLVLGAGGGLGAYAVRFAKLAGARVVATAAEGDVAYVRELGADEVIDFRAAVRGGGHGRGRRDQSGPRRRDGGALLRAAQAGRDPRPLRKAGLPGDCGWCKKSR